MFGHRAAECPNKGAGKGNKGKWKWWQPPATTTRACFGCGSTSYFLKDCPSKHSQHVREIVADEELEVEAVTCEGDGDEHEWLKVGIRRERRGQCRARSLEMTHQKKFQGLEIQTVTKDERWADLGIGDITVDSAADESCWPQGQGDASVTNPSPQTGGT